MTIDEAIKHCKDKACDNTACAIEHKQLAEWLEELKKYRNRELKESEDEKIRKGIIEYLEQSQFGEEHYLIDDDVVRGYISWLEKQGEQKVEPKFKVGDWINKDGAIWRIEGVSDKEYILGGRPDVIIQEPIHIIDLEFRLWTIQDAKDGDVLCYRNDIFLVKSYVLFNRVVSHCTYGERFMSHNIYSFTRADFSKIYPATKEQCDLLFRKMKEAGYEWDAEKKELEKVDTYCQENCKGFQETGRCFCDGECKAKKEHIKQNLQDNDFLRIEQKPAEWTEEDESNLDSAIYYIRREPYRACDVEPIVDWLKSLKPHPHWKPSDEHMKVLKQWLNEHRYDGNSRYIYAVINSLYEQLKSL